MDTQDAQQGITLMEVLVAAAVLTVGMLAALSAMTSGFGAVEAARRSSEALSLAEQRVEEVRAFALGSPPGQGFWRLTAERYPAEPYGTIAGHSGYRRLTEVVVEPDGLRDTRGVRVTVFYRTGGAGAGTETFERLSTLLALP